MAYASEVFLIMRMYWFARAGSTIRNAWASTICRMIFPAGTPRARAASRCPASTPWMPLRTTSAM